MDRLGAARLARFIMRESRPIKMCSLSSSIPLMMGADSVTPVGQADRLVETLLTDVDGSRAPGDEATRASGSSTDKGSRSCAAGPNGGSPATNDEAVFGIPWIFDLTGRPPCEIERLQTVNEMQPHRDAIGQPASGDHPPRVYPALFDCPT